MRLGFTQPMEECFAGIARESSGQFSGSFSG
jgi:hypothetical protein